MKSGTDECCFAHADELMLLAEALDLLKGRLAPVTGREEVPLRHALERILGEDVTAPRDVPPHDNSAVDGYAVYFSDLSETGETRLPLGGRIAAGVPLDRPARPGAALRIFTGAPVPKGPDTVVMQEDCRIEGDAVVLPATVKRGVNKRSRGEDIKTGTVILKSGRKLRPQDIALADARRGLNMFHKVDVPVFGIIENMSYFICPHCSERTEIFSHGGARKEAELLNVDFLGEIPLDMVIRETSDSGNPITVSDPESSHAEAYRAIARVVRDKIDESLDELKASAPKIVVQ